MSKTPLSLVPSTPLSKAPGPFSHKKFPLVNDGEEPQVVQDTVVEEEVVEEEYEEVTLEEIETLELPAKRRYQAIPIIYNHGAMNSNALKVLPAPDFPDPQSLPIPDPELHQI